MTPGRRRLDPLSLLVWSVLVLCCLAIWAAAILTAVRLLTR